MTRTVRFAMGVGSVLAATAITWAVEFLALSYLFQSDVQAAQAAGMSAPGEGAGFHLGYAAWVILIFILVFPLALAFCWLSALKLSER
jgi:hypothetical protein